MSVTTEKRPLVDCPGRVTGTRSVGHAGDKQTQVKRR